MTGSEFAFLAFGLLLGVAAGAALIEVLRARPPSKREVRVTVAPNSIARRRAATLADVDAYAPPAGPARGGPGDRRVEDHPEPAFEVVAGSRLAAAPHLRNGTGNGTPVPAGPAARQAAGGRDSVGISISHEPDPMMTALRAKGAAGAGVLMPSGIESSTVVASSASAEKSSAETPPRQAVGVATMPRPEASSADGGQTGTSEAAAASQADAIAGACDEPRRIADERCQVATRAREGAGTALENLRSAQRAYDDHVTKAEAQAATSDPRAVRTAKEAAQQAFRVAREAGRTRDDIETAARDWLTEINRINLATRESSALAERHRLAAVELAANLERLSVEADAARISAEMAEEACVAAREAVAACQEAAAVLAAGGRRSSPVPTSGPADAEPQDGADDDTDGSMGSRAGQDAVIIKLLRGDREALGRLVARLAGDDPDERRRWQLAIGGLAGGRDRAVDRSFGLRLPDRASVLGTVHPVAVPRHCRGAVVARLQARRFRGVGR